MNVVSRVVVSEVSGGGRRLFCCDCDVVGAWCSPCVPVHVSGGKDAPVVEEPPPPPAPTSLLYATITLCPDALHTSASSPLSGQCGLDSAPTVVTVAPSYQRRDFLQCTLTSSVALRAVVVPCRRASGWLVDGWCREKPLLAVWLAGRSALP